jgi:hypothetical protein
LKKVTIIFLSIVLSCSLLVANAFAAPPFEKEDGPPTEEKGESKGNQPKPSDEKNRGLFKAYQNVAGTPAQEVITALIEQEYSVEEMLDYLNEISEDLESDEDAAEEEGTEEGTTEEEEAAEEGTEEEEAVEEDTEEASSLKLKRDEFKAYADALREEIKKERKNLLLSTKAFADLAVIYEKSGSVEDAAEMQQESVLEDIENIESYKKLGKLYEKLGQKGVKAFVNGIQPKFDVPPIIKDGRTLLPFRAISEALKAEVEYNAEERSVTVTKDGIEVKLFIGSKIAYINDVEVTLDVEPIIVNGRTIVPVRFISEAFNSVVHWEAETQSVIIYDEELSDSTDETTDDTDEDTNTEEVQE